MAAPKKTTSRGKRTVTRRIVKKPEVEQSATSTEQMEGSIAVEQPIPQRIPKRVPIGQRRPLNMDKGKLDPNYEYRHVRGNPANLQRYIDAGYDFVTDDIPVGDAGIMRGTQTDSRVSVPSGDNNDRLFLMRLPKEFYKEDQAAKQQAIDKKEEALKPAAERQGLTGSIDISR